MEVLAFIVIFIPAAVMVLLRRYLFKENFEWKSMAAEFAIDLFLLNFLTIAVAFLAFGSKGNLVETINSYTGFAFKYMLLEAALMVAALIICREFKNSSLHQRVIDYFAGNKTASKKSGEPAISGGAIEYKGKQVYLELIRAASMLLVIFNHTGTKGFMLYSAATNSALYPFYLFISVACKVAVPLYWMVSGALLLPKEESLGKVYRHRVLRMVVVLILFSAVTYIWQILKGTVDGWDFKYFWETIYSSRFATAYWFIYAYIGMLIMLPFLRKLVKVMSVKEFYYLFVVILVLRGLVPILQYLYGQGSVSLNSNVTGALFATNVLYFIGGYYFGDILKDQDLTLKKVFLWAGASLVAIVITCAITQYKIDVTGLSDESNAQTFYNNLICIPTFGIFYAVRYWFIHHKTAERADKIICMFGGAAFGIMLLEKILREELVFIYTALFPVFRSLGSCIIWVLAVYLCGFVITICLKKIPGLKKLI